jgi:hypothetical protein
MGPRFATVTIAVLVLLGASVVAPVRAAPPTVTPSPGYDARLAEQRKAAASAPESMTPHRKALSRRRVRPPG